MRTTPLNFALLLAGALVLSPCVLAAPVAESLSRGIVAMCSLLPHADVYPISLFTRAPV